MSSTWKSLQFVFLVLAIAIAILMAIFALQNIEPANVKFLTWSIESSLFQVILVSVGIGLLIGLLVLTPRLLGLTRLLSQRKKRIRELESLLGETEENLYKKSKRVKFLEERYQSPEESL